MRAATGDNSGKAQKGDWELGSILDGPSFSVAGLSDCFLKPM